MLLWDTASPLRHAWFPVVIESGSLSFVGWLDLKITTPQTFILHHLSWILTAFVVVSFPILTIKHNQLLVSWLVFFSNMTLHSTAAETEHTVAYFWPWCWLICKVPSSSSWTQCTNQESSTNILPVFKTVITWGYEKKSWVFLQLQHTPFLQVLHLLKLSIQILLLDIFLRASQSQSWLIGKNGTWMKPCVACARSIFILSFPKRNYPSSKSIAVLYCTCTKRFLVSYRVLLYLQLVGNTNKTAPWPCTKYRKNGHSSKILLNHMRPHFNATQHCTKCETMPYFGKDLHAPGGTIRTILAIYLRGESWFALSKNRLGLCAAGSSCPMWCPVVWQVENQNFCKTIGDANKNTDNSEICACWPNVVHMNYFKPRHLELAWCISQNISINLGANLSILLLFLEGVFAANPRIKHNMRVT